jgi:hypothetical protein
MSAPYNTKPDPGFARPRTAASYRGDRRSYLCKHCIDPRTGGHLDLRSSVAYLTHLAKYHYDGPKQCYEDPKQKTYTYEYE